MLRSRPAVAVPSKLTSWSYLRSYRGRLALGVFFLLATNVLFLGVPVVLGKIINALGGSNPAEEVPSLAIWLVVFAIAQAIARILSRVMIFNAARDAEWDLRGDLFSHLMGFEPAFYRANPTGDVMSRLTNDVQTVRAMWGAGILQIVNTAFAFATVLFMMIRIDPVLTLWACLPYPSMVLVGRLYGRALYRASRSAQQKLGEVSSSIQEDLTGVNIIKTNTLEAERASVFRTMSESLLRRNMTLTKIRGQMGPIFGGLASLGMVIILWVGGKAVITGRINLGQLIEFNSYLARLVWPTLALGWMLGLIQRGRASWSRLEHLLASEPAIVDGTGGDIPADDIEGNLEIRNLTIAYDERPVLDDVSITMPAGSVTAIVGRTGCGKSTLVEAIPRLIDVPPGSVFLDGRDITELPLGTLRGAIGYAPQEAFLFSTTIAGNIAYGYHRSGSAEQSIEGERHPELIKASTAAGLARDIEALPSGYDTVVGERGITLSGGQRQRVALARAMATLPKVLILDDSLSSVDAETEREILGHLTEIMEGRTAILISHRVAAVKRADQIVVLDAGRVVETGTHDELLAADGLYAEVYRTQLEADPSIAGGDA